MREKSSKSLKQAFEAKNLFSFFEKEVILLKYHAMNVYWESFTI